MALPTTNTVYTQQSGSILSVAVPVQPTLGPHDVLVRITHSGLCSTDTLYATAAPGMALGHEGVGVVDAVGAAVTRFKVGDRAGGGYHRGACGECSYCLTGRDIWCYRRVVFGEAGTSIDGARDEKQNGTLAAWYVGEETFLHRIPDALGSAEAAPLQCAGATVYAALRASVRSPHDRVGIVGIGGVGHLAIQYAAKMGNEVVVFSTSKDKEAEARRFGAAEFYLADRPEDMKEPINTLIVAGRYPNWSKYLVKEVMARDGIIVPVAAPVLPINLPNGSMFFNGYHVTSSLVASRSTHEDMLEFSARHGIKPAIETFEMSEKGITEAVEKLKANKMRYRAVLVAP
ncbi:chaperonin 10-like protein [Lineolata rhizophorae]|uniref:Chaperonin 10-like protein n=1 Tax=Lineolata rhizophorae TaxID=578093 RepID=A0A6A6NVY1_9PEZI|nr:chaperonin 10-like protein [Lineolata rhizophorae]